MLRQGGSAIVSEHTTDERAKTDAAYEKLQRDARAREREREKQAEELKARDDNMARLKALRLARDAAERGG